MSAGTDRLLNTLFPPARDRSLAYFFGGAAIYLALAFLPLPFSRLALVGWFVAIGGAVGYLRWFLATHGSKG